MQALSLAKECYGMKLDLLTNATVVDDVIRFVSQSAGKMQSTSDTIDESIIESNESDYKEDENHLEVIGISRSCDKREIHAGDTSIYLY